MTTIDERIAAILQPLRDELGVIDQEIAANRTRIVELRIDRRRVADILKHADPQQRLAKKPKAQQGVAEQHVDYIRTYLGKNPAARIQVRPLTALLADYGKLRGESYPGPEATRRAVHVLHDRGELRMVARGRGGSKIYAYIGGTNGA